MRFVLFASLVASPAWSQDRDAIIAKAKEEKEFVYYSTTDIRDGTAMVHAFQKKYPFIEPKLLRLGSTQVVVKVLQEHRGGAHLFDVISATSFQFYEIFKENLFQKYESPERRAFAEDFKDKDGVWVSAYHNASVVAYNTNLLKPADLPKSYDNLLESKWKGKMLMDSRETEWYASMLQILGSDKGLRLMRGLAKQDLSFRPGRTLITQVLSAGEAPLAVNDYDHLVQAAKKLGGPVESLPLTPVVSRVTPNCFGALRARIPTWASCSLILRSPKKGKKFSVVSDAARLARGLRRTIYRKRASNCMLATSVWRRTTRAMTKNSKRFST